MVQKGVLCLYIEELHSMGYCMLMGIRDRFSYPPTNLQGGGCRNPPRENFRPYSSTDVLNSCLKICPMFCLTGRITLTSLLAFISTRTGNSKDRFMVNCTENTPFEVSHFFLKISCLRVDVVCNSSISLLSCQSNVTFLVSACQCDGRIYILTEE